MSCRANGYEVCGEFPLEKASIYPLHNSADALVGPRLFSNSNESDPNATGSASGSGVVVRSRMSSYFGAADCGLGGLVPLILFKR